MRYLDDIFVEKVLKHGRGIINNFAILIKLAGIYQSINDAVVNAAGRIIKDLDPLLGPDGEMSLKLAEDSFFIEDVRVKATMSDIDNFSSLSKDMSEKGIGAVTFKAPLQTDDLILLAYAVKGGNELSEIQSTLDSRLTKGISIGGPVFAKKEGSIDFKDVRAAARRAYTKSVSFYMDVVNSIRAGRKPNVKKTKRALQALVDCILKDEGYVLGLTTLRNPKKYTYQHPVNVAIYSMAIGQRLGLKKYALSLLGMAALFHDIGTVEIPTQILSKEKELSAMEMELLKVHPLEGVKHLLRTRGVNDVSIISMIVCLEHHLNPDGSGYPQLPNSRQPVLFSRLVRIADDFDSFISGMVYERRALSPSQALERMHGVSESSYDGRLFRAFFEIFKRRKFGL